MKIIHFLEHYSGGCRLRVEELLNGSPFENIIYVFGECPNSSAAGCVNGINEDVQGKIPYFSYKNKIRNRTIKIQKRIEENQPDLLIAHHGFGSLVKPVAQAASRLDIPFVIDIHSPRAIWKENFEKRSGLKAVIDDFRSERLSRCLFEKAAGICVITKAMADILLDKYGISNNRIWVIPNGVPEWQKKLNLTGVRESPPYRLLYAGMLDIVNGLSFLHEAWDRLPNRYKNSFSLRIAGSGPMADKLKIAAPRSKFEFIGSVPPEKMPDILAETDIVLIPRVKTLAGSLTEPLKLIEAMGAGKIVICSDLPALASHIKDCQNGFIFKPESFQEFQNCLERCLQNTDIFQQISIAARDYALNKFDWDSSRNKIYCLYKQTTEKKGFNNRSL
jgi:glycosyltransferase involved in cell wall biosynthesis